MLSKKIRVLFVCTYNSFRSQVAEVFLNHKYGNEFEAESAGLTIKDLNPLAIQVMEEIGFDLSDKPSRTVSDLLKQGKDYQHIVTVCSREEEVNCPIFPGIVERHYWSDIPDPECFTGSQGEQLIKAREMRDLIEKRVDQFALEVR